MKTPVTRTLSESMGTLAVYLWIIIPIGVFLTIVAAGLAVRLVW